MSVRSKRELLAQVAGRYREGGSVQKTIILDEFVAATGYARKYAIRLLAHPVLPQEAIRRTRARRYGPVVQEALAVCWSAANGICAKRLLLTTAPSCSGSAPPRQTDCCGRTGSATSRTG